MCSSTSNWIFKFLPRGLLALLLCTANLALGQNRVVTLTPHATELVFAAGAGDQMVATVQSSNYPAQAQNLARIGDGVNTSLEQVLLHQPDLVIGWPSPLMQRLRELGIATYVSAPQSLQDILDDLDNLGDLLGTAPVARGLTHDLRQQITQLPVSLATDPLRLVIMASPDDTFVIGRDRLINDAIERCSAINPFSGSIILAPKVSLESMISSQPDLIVTGHQPSDQLQSLAPVLVIDPDLLYRPGPRFIQAVQQICAGTKQMFENRTITQDKSKD